LEKPDIHNLKKKEEKYFWDPPEILGNLGFSRIQTETLFIG
jgi:hypothetical protein